MKKLNQAGFHLWYILLVIVTIGVVGFAGWRVLSKQQSMQPGASNTNKVKEDDPFVKQYSANCEERSNVSFLNSPISIDQLGYIEPMGKMSDGHVTPTDHLYISPLNPAAADNSYNVVMPADGRIVEVGAMPAQYIGDMAGQKVAGEDHRIIIAHSCRYYSIFIHVHQLSDKVKAAVGTLAPNTQKQVAVPLKAGEPIGKIGGNPVDWSLVDVESNLKGFITPKLYEREPWKIHVVDPFSLYSGSLREQLEGKTLRSKKPIGGKIDYDKKGTLQGNWFKAGTHGYEGATPDRYYDGHLSVVPDYIDPNTTIVSVGNWEGKARQFAVKGKVDPTAATKANSPVKYELIPLGYETPEGAPWNGRAGFVKDLTVSQRGAVVGTIAFEVQDGEKLRVETFPGKTAAQVTVLSPASQVYER